MAVGAIVGAWIAYAAVCVAMVGFSWLLTRYYEDRSDREKLPTIVTVIGLSLVLASVTLVPVDIFILSSTVNTNTGERNDWATADEVARQTKIITDLYYALYAIMSLFTFIAIPFAYFYYEEYDDARTAKQRAIGALKYTSFTIVIFFVLFMLGLFLPAAEENPDDPDWYKDLMTSDNFTRAVLFMTAILTLLGGLVFVSYTAYGLTAMPIGMIRGRKNNKVEEIEVAEDLVSTRERQKTLQSKYIGGRKINSSDQKSLDDLERKERLLSRKSAVIEQEAHSWMSRVRACLRPFEVVFGIFFLLVAIFIWISLLLTTIDKTMHSICDNCFLIGNTMIFNPLNEALVFFSKYFPLDYILVVSIIAYFFFSTLSGIVRIGVRFIWIMLYRIRANATAPQGLLLLCMLLMFSLLTLNVFMTSLAPAYMAFGYQRYCNVTGAEGEFPCETQPDQLLPCDFNAPQRVCTPTAISTLVTRTTVATPFFGVAFYVIDWLFLVAVLIGMAVAIFKKKSSSIRLDSDSD